MLGLRVWLFWFLARLFFFGVANDGFLIAAKCNEPEIMGQKTTKRNLSPHQKQIRFFTGMFLVVIIVVTTLIFWLLSRPDFK